MKTILRQATLTGTSKVLATSNKCKELDAENQDNSLTYLISSKSEISIKTVRAFSQDSNT
jgi:hypothetical protein